MVIYEGGGGGPIGAFGLRVERLDQLGLEKIEGVNGAGLLTERPFLIFERAINYYLHQEGASVIVMGVGIERVETSTDVPEVSERDDRTYSSLKKINGKYSMRSFGDRTIQIGPNGMGVPEQDLGWLTGFTEADGCFTVQQRKSKSQGYGYTPVYAATQRYDDLSMLQSIKDQAIPGELEPHNRALLERAVATRNALGGPYQGHLFKGHSEGLD